MHELKITFLYAKRNCKRNDNCKYDGVLVEC